MKCDIVIARYKESLKWFPNFSSKFSFNNAYLYNKYKGDNDKNGRRLECFLPQKDCIKENLKNVGRCDHTYLYHIVHKYDELADVTIFTKGSYSGEVGEKLNFVTDKVFETHDSVFQVCGFKQPVGNEYDKDFSYEYHFTHNNENRENDNKTGFKLHPAPIRPFGKWFKTYFPKINTHFISFKAVMAVSKKHIHQHPKSYYEMFLKQLEESSNPEVAHYIERAWLAIFHPIPESCIFKSNGRIPCPQNGGSRRTRTLKKRKSRRRSLLKMKGGSKETIPIFIICYNQYTYLKSILEQLQKFPNLTIYIIDNKSTYPPLVEYLKTIENNVKVLYQDKNYGHEVYERDDINALGGNKYIVTDPDILLNKNMPLNFVEIMSNLSDKYKTNKIGLALDIKDNINLKNKYKIIGGLTEKTIPEHESLFWQKRVDDPDYEMYHADIDTTFALINKKYHKKGEKNNSIRIAGDFTCKHRPWLIDYEKELLPDEKNYYLTNNISTNFIK